MKIKKATALYRIKANERRINNISNILDLTGNQRSYLEAYLSKGKSLARKDVLTRTRKFEKLVKSGDMNAVFNRLKRGITPFLKETYGPNFRKDLSIRDLIDVSQYGEFYLENKELITKYNKEGRKAACC